VETLTGIKFITWTLVIFVQNPETGRFLFFLAHILAHLVFANLPRKLATTPNFFFANGTCQVIPRLKAHFAKITTHYLFPEYFQSLRAKK
jgi:hypothetical protein